MRTIEIWPDQIEGGDAVADDLSVPYLRIANSEQGLEVLVFLRPEAIEQLLALGAHLGTEGRKAH